ncbi:hypothetical protein DSO57_1024474 [Entomophthora muscae]|uniref:Uncharacterized protein n=1 Tax=Entomophthora muscae TaxID=34485 RepID=A0ACC2TPT3_9FUNG|nr:hypothetical protein DSO57_1024474 [Entomophthora muscae]
MEKNASKQPKGTKCPTKAPKTPKQKPESSKKASPKPIPEQILAYSTGGEESDASLTNCQRSTNLGISSQLSVRSPLD